MTARRTVRSTIVYRGRVVSLRIDEVELPGGKIVQREVVEHRGAVALVALDVNENVLLVRQTRPATGGELLEIPAGTLEAGEDPAACARRELQEETGFSAERLEPLVGFFVAPGYSSEFIHVYVARDLRVAHAQGDEDEEIELVREPLDAALQRIASGEIRDAKTIAALLAYRQRYRSVAG